MIKLNFNDIFHNLINSKSIEEEISVAKDVTEVYKKLLNIINIDELNNKPIHLIGGMALSPKHALDCLHDPIRTVRFLKGIYQAIEVSKKRTLQRPITIVYAGCGPLSTLLVPLFHKFYSTEIQVSLIDIHCESLDCTKRIIHLLGYDNFIKDYVLADATTYIHPSGIDLLISETMDKGLTKEPQVEIIKNLAPQLNKDGILIPEEIRVHHLQAFSSNIPRFSNGQPNSVIDNIHLNKGNKLFIIDKSLQKQTFEFESESFTVPSNYVETPDICIFTKVKVFGDIFLNPSESYITNHIGLNSFYNINDSYKLHYSTTPEPKWTLIK